MEAYKLTDEFTDRAAEQSLIAALARNPKLYLQMSDKLQSDAFVCEPETWKKVHGAIEAGQSPEVPSWGPAADPMAIASRLLDLSQRRHLASLQEWFGQNLFKKEPAPMPVSELAKLLEEKLAAIQAKIKNSQPVSIRWADELIDSCVTEAEERINIRVKTGQPAQGLPTGLPRLDTLLNGLNSGLSILGGGPGVGKTTLTIAIANAAAQAAPVLYVTFENSPNNLILKILASRAKVKLQDVRRGYADLNLLRQAAQAWKETAKRMAFVEGSSHLTVAELQAKALEAMKRHDAKECLVIVDFLQLWAKVSAEVRVFPTIRERVETLSASLVNLASQIHSPVLALSAQNRERGNYGPGKGDPALDSLKESGDLEYQADVVMFLTPADQSEKPPARAVTLTIAKNRYGDVGKVPLVFRPDIADIREVTRE